MARRVDEDKELQDYRNIMHPPEEFDEGFNWKTVIGAVFLGIFLMPATLYLQLVVGQMGSLSQASRWMTIILFAEVARRSFKDLKMQEVYILYFMAGLMMGVPNEAQGLLWNQYMVRSDIFQGMGLSQGIPQWVAPSAEQIREDGHTFFTRAWVPAILLSTFELAIHRLDNYSLGYLMYRITNDVESLPFPMAPVGAAGITALANTREPGNEWRWRCFSIGGMLGLGFGAIYIGVPAVTGAILAQPVMLIPIPWIDFTPAFSQVLPAFPFNITLDMGMLLVGMVIPFWAVMGGLLGVIITAIMCPMLYHYGILTHWNAQMDVVNTMFVNKIDFFLPFEMGLTIAIAVVSLGKIAGSIRDAWRKHREDRSEALSKSGGILQGMHQGWQRLITNNVKRGDFSILIALGLYISTALLWTGLSAYLIKGFPWEFFAIYAFTFVPLVSYATAKLEGLAGQALTIPFIREATYILSGYKGVAIWFAPAPKLNYGTATVEFRILELCGTRIVKSHIYTKMMTVPIILVMMLVTSQLMWYMADVPSEAYPFAQKMWDLRAKNMALIFSSTLEGGSIFMQSWNWSYFGTGLAGGVVLFTILSFLGLPTLLVFGVVRGLGMGTPAHVVLEVTGALLARFYFRKKFGDRWLRFAPVVLAGFSCGMGLIGMVAVAFTMTSKMMSPMVF